MEKNYAPESLESRWYEFWEENGCFAPSGQGKPYCIMLPPPNVTGTLHMGHAFQHTLIDCLVRHHRMRGFNTLWQMGTDHAGIATEMVVSRQLEAEGTRRDDLGREAFVERVWKWKEESGSGITRQMRRLGTSGDWSRERFTMDPELAEAVIETFVRLHEEGLIYRGPRLVNWDPVLETAISDLEVVNSEEQGKLWTMRYPLVDGSGHLEVATTRPETMLGDVCVAVHPEDERYAHLVGRQVTLPLTGREIPVVADDYVDPEFGTGCVKITPAHDFNDWEVGRRQGLEPINVFTARATVNDNAPADYQGLDRFEARKRILADLDAAGLLVSEAPHKLMVPRGDRSGEIIEPWLTDQWFVRMDQLGRRGLELVESGEVEFVPGNWINTYRHWMKNIQDWCISRQLWWGHRIPAWYDPEGNIHVGRDEAEARERSGLGADVPLVQDEDVLETWFSSALWSHSTLGWPDPDRMDQRGCNTWLPTSVLVTGFDIIFFWVARMIMMTEKFTGQVPFRQVYIHGLVRDREGQKMSKSKGNILDPIDLIDGIETDALVEKRTRGLMRPKMASKIEKATRKEFPDGIQPVGADALRFTFAALATPGRDIKFDLSRCEGYRNFINKLWNASRFVLMNTGEQALEPADPEAMDLPARWIRSRTSAVTAAVNAHLAAYRFDLAASTVYDFVWHEFCDWYLELSKPALEEGADPATALATRRTLAETLDAILRLLHPFIPFVTEEIWHKVKVPAGVSGQALINAEWPEAGQADPEAEAEVEWLRTVIQAIRSARTELNMAPGKHLPVMVQSAEESDRRRLEHFAPLIRRLARVESITEAGPETTGDDCAVAMAGNLKLLIPLAGLVDVAEELARLQKQLDRERKGLQSSKGKLENTRFVENAPAEVVEKERQRLAEHHKTVERLEEQIEKMEGLGRG